MAATATSAALAGHCCQCDRLVRVSEPYAFFGRDRLRASLACGHIVLRSEAGIE